MSSIVQHLCQVIPIVDVAEIVYDYFNETKNNYRLVIKQYHSLFSWHTKELNRHFGGHFFLYNYRDHSISINHRHQQKWTFATSDSTTDIWNFKCGPVAKLPRSYYYQIIQLADKVSAREAVAHVC
jgi:hypothetical protein